MTRSEANELLVTRMLALGFAALSTLLVLRGFGGFPAMLIPAQGSAVLSILALAGTRSRVGWHCTYSHPLGILTVLLLLPAQIITLLFALAGMPL